MPFKFKLKSKITLKAAVFIFVVGIVLAGWLFYKSDTYNLIFSPKFRGKKIVTEEKTFLNKDKKSQEHLEKVCREYAPVTFYQQPELAFYEDNGNEINDFTTIDVPDHLHALTGIDRKATYHQRLKAADSLGKNLVPPDKLALLYFLHKRVEKDSLKPVELNAVKNQVIMALMNQSVFPEELALHLVGIYHSKYTDCVIKDYCIQFCGAIYPKINKKENRKLVKDTIIDSLKSNGDISGSGIIALKDIARYPGISKKEVAEAAYSLASNEKASHLSRVPALQVAAKYGHPEALDLARKLLEPEINPNKTRSRHIDTVPVILKMSAIATIGMKGHKQDTALLEQYRKSADIRLRAAAKAALKKIKI